MPVPGMPFEMMLASWPLDRCRTLALPEMSTALSLPRPSSPWHPEQEELKVLWPNTDAAFGSRFSNCFCWANEAGPENAAVDKRIASTRKGYDGSRLICIG